MWIGNNWLDGDEADPLPIRLIAGLALLITAIGFIAGATCHLW